MSGNRPVGALNRGVIYARYSTDLQNERSIEDQITLCKTYAARENLKVVEVYEDRACSGASIMGRDGLLRLLERAREKAFNFVIVEALDRLSRDMEGLAGIHKRLSFLGIEIRAALHPAVLARYEEQLTNLQEGLDRGARDGDSECAEAIRDLVETVTVFRDTSKPGGVEVEIVGRLTALLGEKAYPNGVRGVDLQPPRVKIAAGTNLSWRLRSRNALPVVFFGPVT
jgi:Resolvase, N terminal domain